MICLGGLKMTVGSKLSHRWLFRGKLTKSTEAIDFGPANFKLNTAQKRRGDSTTDKVSHFQSPAMAAPFRHGDANRIHWIPGIF